MKLSKFLIEIKMFQVPGFRRTWKYREILGGLKEGLKKLGGLKEDFKILEGCRRFELGLGKYWHAVGGLKEDLKDTVEVIGGLKD